MANMSYCRFRNTKLDMENCLEAIREEKNLSAEEARAGRRMFEDILDLCRDYGIIDTYDSGVVEDLFDGMAERRDEDDE